MTAASRSHPGKRLFLASMALSILLCLVLVTRDAKTYTIAAGALGALAVLGLFAPARASRILLALGVLGLLTVVPELGLRAANFSYASGVQFGYPTPDLFWHLVPDEELFWTLPPEDEGVSSIGFLGEDPIVPKPAGTTRLLFLGDSCSQQGHPEAYPDIVEHLLRSEGRAVDCVNLSMAGYSSHQGLVLARRFGELLEPDVAIVYYGWNDHWLAYGSVDAEKTGSLRGERLYRKSRLLQAVRRAAVSTGLKRAPEPLATTRVPLRKYSTNLKGIVARFLALGVPVVLVTAPSSHERLGVPPYLVKDRFARDASAVLELHRDYNQVVREVAADGRAHLLDLASAFETGVDLRATFLEDGIHLSEAGRWTLARRVVDFLEAAELVGGDGQ